MSVKNLDRGGLRGVQNIPVINARVRHEAESSFTDPFPKHNVLIHGMRLQLPFRIQVENLQCALGLEGYDVLGPVHDGAVGLDGSPRNAVAIVEIDNHDLG